MQKKTPAQYVGVTYSFLFWRRERDSNPRTREDQRFSRPPHSTTLPSLQRQKYGTFFKPPNIFAIFLIKFFAIKYCNLRNLLIFSKKDTENLFI